MRGQAVGGFEVEVSREELLEKIVANRDRHREIFDKALTAYRDKVIEVLDERIENIRSGGDIDVFFHLPVPEDHTEDYDRVIDMLEMHKPSTLTIGSADYACYVRDDWVWKRQWATTNAYYVGAANAQ